MSDERELKPVQPCTLPVNNLSLEPEYFGERVGRTSVYRAMHAEFSMTDARWKSTRTPRRVT